jgi:hypothetical protein
VGEISLGRRHLDRLLADSAGTHGAHGDPAAGLSFRRRRVEKRQRVIDGGNGSADHAGVRRLRTAGTGPGLGPVPGLPGLA